MPVFIGSQPHHLTYKLLTEMINPRRYGLLRFRLKFIEQRQTIGDNLT